MAVQTTYPGVYIVEQPSGSHVISGVSTSVTAFVGAARQGIADTPVAITSYADFVRQFGDPIDNTDHPMGHAVAHFFTNGGSQAVVVRALAANAHAAVLALPAQNGVTLTVTARSRGGWANGTGSGAKQQGIWVQVIPAVVNPADRFTMIVTSFAAGPGAASILARETWPELSMSPAHPRFVSKVLAASALINGSVTGAETVGAKGFSVGTVDATGGVAGVEGRTLRIAVDQHAAVDHVLFPGPAANPATTHTTADLVTFINDATHGFTGLQASDDGGKLRLTSDSTGPDSAVVVGLIGPNDASGALGLGVANGGTEESGSVADRPAVVAATGLAAGDDGADVAASSIVSPSEGQGMFALDVLNFPRFNLLCLPGVTTADPQVSDALAYCADQKAFLLVDPAPSVTRDNAVATAGLYTPLGAHGGMYWPRLITAESTDAGLPPCGAVAGVMARTDDQRGVWKAPAGIAAGLAGATGFAYPTSDAVSGALNRFAVNVLRSFPGAGLVVWGARTLAGTDILNSDSKYVPIRRLTDYIASSLYLGTQFAVFEPNDPVLWGQLRLAVGGFMRGLFRQGAFQQQESRAESDSFFVICDSTVNPPTEIDLGRVNVVAGFAPLKPAEFVVVTITQTTNAGG